MFDLKKKIENGVTLLELIVVIAIISIMSAIILTSLSAGKKQKTLDEETRKVMAVIKDAQNGALTGRGASSSCGSYSFSATVGGAYNTSGCLLGSFNLENGVTFAGDQNFSFSPPHGKIFKEGVELAASINVQLTLEGNSRYICIYPSGEIKNNGTNNVCN